MVSCLLVLLLIIGCDNGEPDTPRITNFDASPIPAPPGMVTFGKEWTDDELVELDVREDGGVLLAYTQSYQSVTGYTYGLMSPDGHLAWSNFTNSWGGPAISLRAAAGNTGVVVARGWITSTPFTVSLFDAAGTVTQTLDVSSTLTSASAVVRQDDGRVCIAGSPDNNQHGCIVTLDPEAHDSSRMWMLPVSDHFTYPRALVDVHDGTLLLTGYTNAKSGGGLRPFLIRFTPGTQQYTQYDLPALDGTYIRAVTRVRAGVFACAVYDTRTFHTIPHVRCMNLGGTVLWDRSWPAYEGFTTTCIGLLPDGGLIVGGYKGTATRTGFLLCLDASGNERWTRTIERVLYDNMGRTPYPVSSTDAACVVVTNDGDIICGGSTTAYGSGCIDTWLMRLHPDGSIVTTFGR